MYSRVFKRPTMLVLGLLVTLVGAGCSKSTTAPTPQLTTDTFQGVVGVLGTSSQQFTVNYSYAASDGSISVTAMNAVSNNAAFGGTIGIGFGSIAFDGSCTLAPTYTNNAAALNQVMTASGVFINGIYCFSVFDKGTLTEPINYTVVVKHY
jgi:hypothetical protein